MVGGENWLSHCSLISTCTVWQVGNPDPLFIIHTQINTWNMDQSTRTNLSLWFQRNFDVAMCMREERKRGERTLFCNLVIFFFLAIFYMEMGKHWIFLYGSSTCERVSSLTEWRSSGQCLGGESARSIRSSLLLPLPSRLALDPHTNLLLPAS